MLFGTDMRRCCITTVGMLRAVEVRLLLVPLIVAVAFSQHDGMIMHGMGGMNMSMGNTTGCGPLDICVTEPTRENCTLPFKLPHPCSVADATNLCNAMPFMTACSVAKQCNISGADWAANAMGPGKLNVSQQNENICRPFQHVVTVCRLDTGMSKMAGCKNYNSMCVNGSRVDMCTNVTGLTELPTTRVVNDQVRSICEARNMPRCEECMPSWQANKTWGNCDLLDVYSSLCRSAPDLEQCSDYQKMCQADPTLWLCNNSAISTNRSQTLDASAASATVGGNASASASKSATSAADNTVPSQAVRYVFGLLAIAATVAALSVV